jgi:hypothetical protein
MAARPSPPEEALTSRGRTRSDQRRSRERNGGFSVAGVSSSFNDRTNLNPVPFAVPAITYHSEWKFVAAATLGAAVYF